MDNKVIKVLTPEHGKMVIEWWKLQGISTGVYRGINSEEFNDVFIYYGVINGLFDHYCFEFVMMRGAEIIELPREILKPENIMSEKKRKITGMQAQSIIDSACEAWKVTLAKAWGMEIVLGMEIEIADNFYKCMRDVCTARQNILFDEIFGKDHYPDGTPCLVADGQENGWHLRYADGKGNFYYKGHKTGATGSWTHHMELDINNLPVKGSQE